MCRTRTSHPASSVASPRRRLSIRPVRVRCSSRSATRSKDSPEGPLRRLAQRTRMTTGKTDARLRQWQVATAGVLLVGYAGYYVCRSNLSVVIPALLADSHLGMDRAAIGLVSSAGIVAYAAGKSITGVIGDFYGGRVLFLGGLFLSVVATMAFSASMGLPLMLLFWVINRFVQSAGWAGLTKIASHWYPAHRYGLVMSVLSLSFLFGDALGRYALGQVLRAGWTWRDVFVLAALTLGVIGLV